MSNQAQDCHLFFNSICTKGESCWFRHCEAAKGSETVCKLWQENRCFRKVCKYRHMEMHMELACYWEKQPVGCQRPHCAFHHKKSRIIDGVFLPASKSPVPRKEDPHLHRVIKTEIMDGFEIPRHPPVIINLADHEDEDDYDIFLRPAVSETAAAFPVQHELPVQQQEEPAQAPASPHRPTIVRQRPSKGQLSPPSMWQRTSPPALERKLFTLGQKETAPAVSLAQATAGAQMVPAPMSLVAKRKVSTQGGSMYSCTHPFKRRKLGPAPAAPVKPSAVKPAAPKRLVRKRKASEGPWSAIAAVKPLNCAPADLEEEEPPCKRA